MNTVKMRLRFVYDKELAAARVRTAMCHGERAANVSVRVVFRFARDRVARTADTRTVRAAALCYEARDNAVEAKAVVEAFIDKFYEVSDRTRCIFFEQFDNDVALCHFDNSYNKLSNLTTKRLLTFWIIFFSFYVLP